MSLIEVLISLLVIVLASIATLQYFAYAKGAIGKTGTRRAALEQARARLDQLMAAQLNDLPPKDGNCYACNAATCVAASWTLVGATCPALLPNGNTDLVTVNTLTGMRRETTAQFVDDPSANTTGSLDVFTFGVKVWFLPGSTNDDFNRVDIQTLRTPS